MLQVLRNLSVQIFKRRKIILIILSTKSCVFDRGIGDIVSYFFMSMS